MRDLIQTIRESQRNLSDDIRALEDRLDEHADNERRQAQAFEDLIRKEVVNALPRLCQANDLGAAIRTVTYERKKEQENEAIVRAVKEVTGQHKLLDPEDNSLTPAQQRSIGKFVKRWWLHISGGVVASHWVGERIADLVKWLQHFGH